MAKTPTLPCGGSKEQPESCHLTSVLADGEQVGKVPMTMTEEIIFKHHFPGVSELAVADPKNSFPHH